MKTDVHVHTKKTGSKPKKATTRKEIPKARLTEVLGLLVAAGFEVWPASRGDR